MLDQETKRRIDNARDILVGKVPDPKSQVEQITIALIYKFMDDMDKESIEWGGKASFFTGEFEKYAWSKIFDPRLGGFDLMTLYSEAIIKMNQNPNIPQLFRDIFKNAYLPYRDPETLKSFLKEISGFQYDHSERLGDAFEYLLSVLSSQGDAGQFRTPRHIIDFIVEILDPKKDETIADPACGTAGFLISSYKHILKANTKERPGDQLTTDERKRLMNNLAGYDISPDMVRLSLVNMYLHGFPYPKIHEYDTLTSEDRWNETFDVIMANPPFMSPKGGIRPHKRFSIMAKRSEVLFVDYIAEHLNPNGRAGIIVPEGIIFQSQNAYKALRKMLVENYLFAVVSLPAGVFNPYSGVKTSILLMDKALAKKIDSILFVKIENDGFDLGAQRRPNGKNDLPEAMRAITNYKLRITNGDDFNTENISNVVVVEKDKIGDNGYWDLSGDRYKIEDIYLYSKFPMFEIGNICNLINGKAFKPSDWNTKESGGLPIIRIQNLNDKSAKYNYYTGDVYNKYIVNKNDLLFSWSGSRGTSFGAHIWEGGKAILNQHIFKVEHLDSVLRRYLFYALNQAVKEVEENLHGGVGLVHITKGNLEKIKIPLPPLEVQQEIVAEIEGYRKIIDGARQVVENYKPQIKIDPEWEMVELGEVCEKFCNGVNFSREQVGKGVKFVNIKDLFSDGFVNNSDLGRIQLTEKEIIRRKVSNNDLLFVRSSVKYEGVGYPSLIKVEVENIVFCGFIIKCSPNMNIVEPKYLLWLLRTELYRERTIALSNKANITNISQDNLKSLRIPIPDLETQNRIVAGIDKERELVNANKELIKIYEQNIKDKIAEVWGE